MAAGMDTMMLTGLEPSSVARLVELTASNATLLQSAWEAIVMIEENRAAGTK